MRMVGSGLQDAEPMHPLTIESLTLLNKADVLMKTEITFESMFQSWRT